MSEPRVSQNSFGAMIVDQDFEITERGAFRVIVVFTPVHWFVRLKNKLGLANPSPALLEIHNNFTTTAVISKRKKHDNVVIEECSLILFPGKSMVRLVIDPKGFEDKWDVNVKIVRLDN